MNLFDTAVRLLSIGFLAVWSTAKLKADNNIVSKVLFVECMCVVVIGVYCIFFQ